ncbi:MAG: hypothetical protein Q7R96_04000 [Nanoarchaeota archaeon]|nr:hypothetical protein [Nanoarchaeota archaeon]
MKVIRGYACVNQKTQGTFLYGLREEKPQRFPAAGIDTLCHHAEIRQLQTLLQQQRTTVDYTVLLQLTIALQEEDEARLATRKRFVILNGEKPLGYEGSSFQWFGPRTTEVQSYDGKKNLEENNLTPFEVGKLWPFTTIRRHRSEVQRQTMNPTYLAAFNMRIVT